MKVKTLQRIYINGVIYDADKVIDVSEDVAKALGNMIKILEHPPKDKMIKKPPKKK
jgi:hypothetical protein